jgi:hypothetical protein
MATSVFGIAKSSEQAATVVGRLKYAGFRDNDISVLLADKSGTRDFAHEQNTKAPEGATTGAGIGGALGGALGLMAGLGALAIPGVGPLIAVGPIMGALSGAAVGAAVGGLGGALVGLGIPEYEAKRYEGKILGGNVLISVHAADSTSARNAQKILEENGIEDVHSASEASPDIKVPSRDPRTRV